MTAAMPRIRVLIADDHEEMRKCVCKCAGTEFEVVACVSDGDEALEAATRLHPDVAVLDILMPGLNGIEAAKRLREVDPDLKVVFLTADRDPSLFCDTQSVGLGFVLKPYLSTDLIPAIKNAAEGRRFVSPKLKLEAR